MSLVPIEQTDNGRVLLVEDDDGLVDSISAILTDAGYLLSTCQNGLDALAQLKADPPDLVILDLMMPIMNGWEFRAAQRADPAIADVPVVVISADRTSKAAAVHADSYVGKPFRAGELLHEVERVLLERARQDRARRLEETGRMTLLGHVAAEVGHDINNPLAFAMGNLELIDEELSGLAEDLAILRDACRTAYDTSALARVERRLATTKNLLRDGRTGADRVRRIVRNLQSLAQPAGDRRKQLDLRLILDRCILAASARIDCRSKVIRDYHEGAEVWGNERQLTNLFLNLLVNAAESIPPGRVEANTIRVTIELVENWCVVEIGDNGSGMSNALRQRIFEPFFTTKGREGGMGLGLAICRDIVESHGGQIEAESIGEAGSVFRVRLTSLSTRQPEADFRTEITRA
jgi:signal transduction histidine kinase